MNKRGVVLEPTVFFPAIKKENVAETLRKLDKIKTYTLGLGI
jgi:hypothetical protein